MRNQPTKQPTEQVQIDLTLDDLFNKDTKQTSLRLQNEKEAPQTDGKNIQNDLKGKFSMTLLNDQQAAEYYTSKTWTEAMDAYKKNLEMNSENLKMERKKTEDHHIGTDIPKDLLISRIDANKQMAETQKEQGLYNEAEKAYREIVEAFSHNGNLEKNESLASVYIGLGYILTKKDQFNEALGYYQEAINIYTLLKKTEDADVANVYEGMGEVYRYQEKFEECVKFLNMALEIRVKILGSEDLSVARIYDLYTQYYLDISEIKKAKEYSDMSLQIKLKIQCKPIDLAQSYYRFGLVYNLESKFEEAINYLEMAIDIYNKEQLQFHPGMIELYHRLGSIQLKQTKYNEALQSCQMAEMIIMSKFGPNHHLLANVYETRGLALFQKKRKFKDSENYFEKCMEMRVNVFGKQHLSIASLYNSLGSLYNQMKLHAKALECFDLALGVRLQKFGEGHISLATLYNNMAVIYNSIGDVAKSLEYLKKSLEIRKKYDGNNNIETARSKHNIGIAYRRLEDYRSAIGFATDALNSYIKIWGMYHPDVIKAAHQLALNYKSVGNIKEAVKLSKVCALVNERSPTKNLPEALRSVQVLGDFSKINDQVNINVVDII